MSDENEKQDKEKEAGFEFGINFPLVKWRFWGGPAQLAILMPILRWGLIIATALGTVAAIKEILFK